MKKHSRHFPFSFAEKRLIHEVGDMGPKAQPEDNPDKPVEDDPAKKEAREEGRKQLSEAREFVKENEEALQRATTDVVKAYNEHENNRRNRTAYPDFEFDNEGFQKFHQDPAIREVFERFNAGDEKVKRYLIRVTAEMFDTATNGKPYQYILRRKLFNLRQREVTDKDGRSSKTQKDFEKNMKEHGLMTMHSPEGATFISEYIEFLEMSGPKITEAFKKAANGPRTKLEDWFDPRRSSGVDAAAVATMLGRDFYQHEHVQALKQLYRRAKYVEGGDGEVFFLNDVDKWIKKSGFHSKERFGELKVREAILDHEPRER